MNRSLSTATIVIAIYSISTGAIGQSGGVYRCGNTYSQKPCADGVVVEVQDTRTAEQKAQADATTRRDTAIGNDMEKGRLAEEARQRTAQDKLAAAEQKQSASKPNKTASQVDTADTTAAKNKRKKTQGAKKKATPEVFIASAPGEKSKPAARPSKQP